MEILQKTITVTFSYFIKMGIDFIEDVLKFIGYLSCDKKGDKKYPTIETN